MEESEFLWQHFKFNAEQRLKAFNFFVILSIFADGGIFTAIEKGLSPYLLIILGGFIVVLSIVFWLVDHRSKTLVRLAVPGLKKFESLFDSVSHLFDRDALGQGSFRRYTFAFRVLFVCQIIFGLFVMAIGTYKWFCS